MDPLAVPLQPFLLLEELFLFYLKQQDQLQALD